MITRTRIYKCVTIRTVNVSRHILLVLIIIKKPFEVDVLVKKLIKIVKVFLFALRDEQIFSALIILYDLQI